MSNRDETIDRLRGQLQNCVNHLDGVKRRYPSMSERLDACIKSGNNALYETLHEDISATALQADRIAALEALVIRVAKKECKCTFAQRWTGDGCEVCNLKKLIEMISATAREDVCKS